MDLSSQVGKAAAEACLEDGWVGKRADMADSPVPFPRPTNPKADTGYLLQI